MPRPVRPVKDGTNTKIRKRAVSDMFDPPWDGLLAVSLFGIAAALCLAKALFLLDDLSDMIVFRMILWMCDMRYRTYESKLKMLYGELMKKD